MDQVRHVDASRKVWNMPVVEEIDVTRDTKGGRFTDTFEGGILYFPS